MIAIRLEGRLGNQLFQYAFICSTAKKLKTNFYIDEFSERSLVNQYFMTSVYPSGLQTNIFDINGFKNIFNYYLRRQYYKISATIWGLKLKDYGISTNVAVVEIEDKIMYSGYFQSELFFREHENFIRENFVIKPKFINQFDFLYSRLYQKNKIVAVHIRRTDYKKLSHLGLGGADLSLPLSYYKNAIATFDVNKVHFVFIGDDDEFIEQNFSYIKNKTIAADSDIMDFQHLLNAQACIISNSTYSWWGAWLNCKPNKVIYAPQYFMGWRIKQEFPENIYPGSWNIVSFD